MKKDKKTTQGLINDFNILCDRYSCEDIDTKMLRKGVKEVIDNWS